MASFNTYSRLHRLLTVYQRAFFDVLTSPACWLFITIYLLALLLYIPAGGAIAGLQSHLYFHPFYLLTIIILLPLTSNAPMANWKAKAEYSQCNLWWQTIFVLFIIALLIAYSFWLFDFFVPQRPLLEQHYYLLALLIPWFTPLILSGLLLIITHLLGVPWNELGFGRGYRSWLISGICGLISICMIFRNTTLTNFFASLPDYFLMAGFPEEIIFRGILLTRLIRLFGTKWGIVLSSLVFGIVHMAANLSYDSNILLSLCVAILEQTTTGITLAIIFVRTRNIFAGVIFHTLLDAI
jgi:membrane protease YdiL (CAAX protease family)